MKKNELVIQDERPLVVKLQEEGVQIKNLTLGAPEFNVMVTRVFRILGLVEKEKKEMQTRYEIAAEAIATLQLKYKSFTIDEVIHAFRLASLNELPLKEKIRSFNSNSLGDLLTAYKIYKAEKSRVYRRKERDQLALGLTKTLLLEAPVKPIEEIAEQVKNEYLETGEISIWFSRYWTGIWRYFLEEEDINMEQYRKTAETIIKSERTGLFVKHLEISEREIKIKMAELSLVKYWKNGEE